MHKTLIFDLGKVLVAFDFKRGYQALQGLCPYSVEEIPRVIRTTDLVKRFETGLIEPLDFYERFSKLLGLTIDYQRFCQIWTCIFTDELIPNATIAALSKRYRLVLLSNTNAIHFDMVRNAYPVVGHFHHLILSHEVKLMKPDPAIYQVALDHAQCEPGECLYVDDILENVDAGHRAGLDAVQFESVKQIEGEMKQRGIRWD